MITIELLLCMLGATLADMRPPMSYTPVNRSTLELFLHRQGLKRWDFQCPKYTWHDVHASEKNHILSFQYGIESFMYKMDFTRGPIQNTYQQSHLSVHTDIIINFKKEFLSK